MVNTTISELGRVDILVNNAGIIITKPVVPMPGVKSPSPLFKGFEEGQSEEDWRRVIDTNLTSVFLCCRAVGRHMIERRSGKIINMASMEAAKAIAYHTSYAASKAGVRLFTQSLAREWARYNIHVNAIGPGPMLTDMMAPVLQDDRLREKFILDVPLRRWGNPREIGLLAVYLASNASDYMTGQTVFIDGGFLA
jgi:NAD(P)-dependent dehydrogenase (short-subunit alcohol dehydrogenase family)